jgi:hypothetical protein
MNDNFISNEFYAGIYRGLIQNIVGHPLDTMKVLLQNRLKYNDYKFKHLYRGFSYPLYKLVITNSIIFDLDAKLNNNGYNKEYLNGAIVGATISPIVHIFDVFKIKQQSKIKCSFKDFIRPQSFLLSFSRETIGFSMYLGSYFKMKENGISPFIAGGLSGCLNWTSSYVIDTLKTRSITYNKNIKECVMMGNYWKGYRMCMIRGFIVNSFGFQAYESALKYINDLPN